MASRTARSVLACRDTVDAHRIASVYRVPVKKSQSLNPRRFQNQHTRPGLPLREADERGGARRNDHTPAVSGHRRRCRQSQRNARASMVLDRRWPDSVIMSV